MRVCMVLVGTLDMQEGSFSHLQFKKLRNRHLSYYSGVQSIVLQGTWSIDLTELHCMCVWQVSCHVEEQINNAF